MESPEVKTFPVVESESFEVKIQPGELVTDETTPGAQMLKESIREKAIELFRSGDPKFAAVSKAVHDHLKAKALQPAKKVSVSNFLAGGWARHSGPKPKGYKY